MKVQLLNILEPLPFGMEYFDVIHARLFFMHVGTIPTPQPLELTDLLDPRCDTGD